eukprot:gnl/TRDRNA2_/TRDRNA2_149715_c0_seq4.p1 gnl/TRDRNA2_/TRDRNA2_149715_c0~~gnl/TRDRNA2_/TRDRNA2_149715_c0_seq4.p1  ORF type:complete len:136 (+),score=8.46 gnl/TRDRNA2_/TRDRNA2_149715_c0_seq4:178-585(+)
MPGSSDQHLHRDGTDTNFVNIFVPLVDVHEANGPTEFITGSHKDLGNRTKAGRKGPAPEVRKGDILIFRYTCLHWGHGNRGRDSRPIAYFVIGPQIAEDGGDGVNFGHCSVTEASERNISDFGLRPFPVLARPEA